jgi:5-methylcytosine-specific restriction endonuclease McrA
VSSKVCKGCGVEKELSEFYAVSRNSDGCIGKCKSCVKAAVKANRRKRSEQYATYERLRANLPHRVEARRAYQKAHKEEINEYKKRWRRENAQMVSLRSREHYERNKDEIVARSKKWAEGNPEKVSSAKADNRRKRRAAKHTSLGSFTAEEFEELCERYGNRCLACGGTEIRLEADHVVPLTKGGSNDISNIQPLCGFCNRRKFVDIVDYRVIADAP